MPRAHRKREFKSHRKFKEIETKRALASVEDKLWQWASKMDDTSVIQFGLSIVGIGALFFAYGQVSSANIKLLIALIGLAGSVILWLHLYATRKELFSIKKRLENDPFIIALNGAQQWRGKGINRVLYHNVSRLMTYFMGLVSWAWLAIIVRRMGLLSVLQLSYLSLIPLGIAFSLTIIRKIQGLWGNE